MSHSKKKFFLIAVFATFLSAAAAIAAENKPAAPPAGSYACAVLAPGSFFDTGVLQVLADQQYIAIEGGGGTYVYNPANRAVQFKTGPYAKGEIGAQFFPNGIAKGGVPKKRDPVIVLKPTMNKKVTGVENIPTQYCYLRSESKTRTQKDSAPGK
jgi:hypothetical protein